MSVPQSPGLKNALWENNAEAARTEAIPILSRILSATIAPNDFTVRSEFEDHMERCQSMKLLERRFPIAKRNEVLSLVQKIPGLNRPKEALLFFGRSSSIGGLRVRSTPSAETLMSLLDWDRDDIFVFDGSDALIVHVDLGEDRKLWASRRVRCFT